ncbi:hypothetical protein QE152_g41443, partial [Popillia japonica]
MSSATTGRYYADLGGPGWSPTRGSSLDPPRRSSPDGTTLLGLGRKRPGGATMAPALRQQRVIVTPAVYPRLLEFLHVDIQSTGQ